MLGVESGLVEGTGREDGILRNAASDMRRRRWRNWLESELYGRVVQGRLDELDEGMLGVKRMDIGRSEKRVLERAMRKYVLVEAAKPKLFFREENGKLASCILEIDVKRTLADLHQGHGHFASSRTLARAHGKIYWPSRANAIGR